MKKEVKVFLFNNEILPVISLNFTFFQIVTLRYDRFSHLNVETIRHFNGKLKIKNKIYDSFLRFCEFLASLLFDETIDDLLDAIGVLAHSQKRLID